MFKNQKYYLILVSILMSGCAGTTAIPVTDKNPNPKGFLVNSTSTVFLQDDKGIRPVTYADPCKRYAVNIWAIAAKNNSTLTLSESGTLESIAANIDTTEVPIKVLELGGKVIDKIPEGFKAASAGAPGSDSAVRFFDVECGLDGQSYLVQRQTVGKIASAVPTSSQISRTPGNSRPDLVK